MGILELELEKGLYLGIDFGTTNSVASIYDFKNGEVHTVQIDGNSIFPTAVQFEADPDDEKKIGKVFGSQARDAAAIYPFSTVLSIKRSLGSDEKMPIVIDEREYKFSPEHIAGEILAFIKERATFFAQEELDMRGEFSGCVITVPANSTDKQKKKTKEAAILAGFDEDSIHLRLEPAAAAISYAINEESDKTALIYDFGGGTFDACIIKITANKISEPNISIASAFGDNDLGGNDIDKIIIDMILEEFNLLTENEFDLYNLEADDGISKRQKKIAQIRLKQAAVQAKERLSKAKTTKITLAPFIQEPRIVNINMEISQEDFEDFVRKFQQNDSPEIFEKYNEKNLNDILNLTLDCIDKCLAAANLQPQDIDEIFLVGGSSSLPIVERKIIEKFAKIPFKSKISPALSISRGAALYCSMIMMPTLQGPTVSEKTIHSLGLEIAGRRFLEIVAPGLEIPREGLAIEAPELLTPNFDYISSMAIVVYENTLPSVDSGAAYVYKEGMKRLAGSQLKGIPQAPRGQEKVQVIFNIGQDNILKVLAKSTSIDGLETELIVDELY